MKKLILSAVIAVGTLIATQAQAGHCGSSCGSCKTCSKPAAQIFPGLVKKYTKEICRRNYYKTICVNGCVRRVRYTQVTYKTVYCNGTSKTWTSVYRS